jgi:hypothetical protein
MSSLGGRSLITLLSHRGDIAVHANVQRVHGCAEAFCSTQGAPPLFQVLLLFHAGQAYGDRSPRGVGDALPTPSRKARERFSLLRVQEQLDSIEFPRHPIPF